MQLIDRVFSFYVFSNIHVALSTSSLVVLTLAPYELQDHRTVLFVFCGTILSYNFIRAVEMDRLYPSLSHWIRSRARWLMGLNVFAFLGLIYTIVQYSILDLVFVLPFFLLTVFYVFPFRGKYRGLRNLPGLKLFLISAVWAGVTALFPLWVNELLLGDRAWIVFCQRFLLVMAITIPFDIRDLQLDKSDLATLPQILGVNKAKLLALGALGVFVLLFFAGNLFNWPERWIGLAIGLISAGFVIKAGVYQNRFYSSFWVESIPIFWMALTVVVPQAGF